MNFLNRIAALAATLFAAAACIYPYEVEISQSGELPLVVEGDILVGAGTTVFLSYVKPFDKNDSETVYAQGYIEGEDGTRVNGVGVGSLSFDTENLPEGQRYRLHLETLSAAGELLNSFESDWLLPCPAPTIDNLSYSKNIKFNELWIGLSMHCNGAHHFRWSFSETWEYHSDIHARIEYIPETREIRQYTGPTLYYCWKSEQSPQINIFSTANQTEDRFEDLAFHTIPLNDKRLQVMYRITVQLQAMSEDAYNYWYNMQQNSEGQGSIFSPTPSEMASNVHCISDPSVQVMGYLNAAVPAKAQMYYDNSMNHFYVGDKPFFRDDQTVKNDPDSSAYWYSIRYLPFEEIYEDMSEVPTYYTWTPASCIDCRLQGGTKEVPEGWPTGHN